MMDVLSDNTWVLIPFIFGVFITITIRLSKKEFEDQRINTIFYYFMGVSILLCKLLLNSQLLIGVIFSIIAFILYYTNLSVRIEDMMLKIQNKLLFRLILIVLFLFIILLIGLEI